MKYQKLLAVFLCIPLIFSGCGKNPENTISDSDSSTPSSGSSENADREDFDIVDKLIFSVVTRTPDKYWSYNKEQIKNEETGTLLFEDEQSVQYSYVGLALPSPANCTYYFLEEEPYNLMFINLETSDEYEPLTGSYCSDYDLFKDALDTMFALAGGAGIENASWVDERAKSDDPEIQEQAVIDGTLTKSKIYICSSFSCFYTLGMNEENQKIQISCTITPLNLSTENAEWTLEDFPFNSSMQDIQSMFEQSNQQLKARQLTVINNNVYGFANSYMRFWFDQKEQLEKIALIVSEQTSFDSSIQAYYELKSLLKEEFGPLCTREDYCAETNTTYSAKTLLETALRSKTKFTLLTEWYLEDQVIQIALVFDGETYTLGAIAQKSQ